MKTQDLNKKSKADLKVIAEMMGLALNGNESKAALVELITGESGEEKSGVGSKQKAAGRDVSVKAEKETADKESSKPKAREQKMQGQTKTAKQKSADTPKKRGRPSSKENAEPKEKAAASAGAVEEKTSELKRKVPSKAQGEQKSATKKRERKSGAEKNAAKDIVLDEVPSAGSNAMNIADSTETAAEIKSEENVSFEDGTGGNVASEESTDNGESAETAVSETEENSAKKTEQRITGDASGILEIMPDGYGFLRSDSFCNGPRDVYVPPTLIKRFGLRNGDYVGGKSKPQKDHSVSQALIYINEINGKTLDQLGRRPHFEQLTPIYPDSKLTLEKDPAELSTRLIDMFAPIGKGQRGMIVSPPKAGKTVLMKKIANSISDNYPEVELIVLLIDERPEEVTDMRESVRGTVVSSTFDELPERHIKVSELVLDRAQRLVEMGKDVVILMDSLTRLARAYNLTIPPTGRSLSGGLDPGALHRPKKFFGAARNIRGGGSLTIVATALVDTGSRLDDVIFEEFKGTGNMELHLDRKLSEKRIFPAIDISKSGTRKEELLLTDAELNAIYSLRKAISNIGAADATDMIIDKLSKSKDNSFFIANLKPEK